MNNLISPLTGLLVVIMVSIAVYNLLNTRNFGFYPDNTCAYEQRGDLKMTCPLVMPDRYNRHTVSYDN